MGKKKSLKHKKLTDVRRRESASKEVPPSGSQPQTLSYSFSPVSTTRTRTPAPAERTVVADVRKTAFISLAIVALEVLLFILLQNHVLALPFVRY